MDIRNELNDVKFKSISDALIKTYLPDAEILLYNDLKNYKTIEELLPKDKSFVIILYDNGETSYGVRGHWTALTRLNNEISYFDSYGKPPDYAIDNWFKNNKYQQMKYLSNLFDKTPMDVYYNGIQYQGNNTDISTCGRYVIFYIKNMQQGKDLNKFYILMKNLKNKSNLTFDKLVSYMINNIG